MKIMRSYICLYGFWFCFFVYELVTNVVCVYIAIGMKCSREFPFTHIGD